MQTRQHEWNFVPHYPYPGVDRRRRFAIGMQQGGGGGFNAFKLLVHTTHARVAVDGCTEQLLLSNSAQVPPTSCI